MSPFQGTSSREKRLLASVDAQKLLNDTTAIASFDRRSGSKGERGALDFIANRLSQSGIDWCISNLDVWLSNPKKASLKAFDENNDLVHIFNCKTWSFDAPSNGPVRGHGRFIKPVDLTHNPLTWLADRSTLQTYDFSGAVIVSTTSSPVAVMNAADRGADAFVHIWPQGEELLIHEGNTSMIWGQPEPSETSLYPTIPVVHISFPEGQQLLSFIQRQSLTLVMETELENSITSIPILEAWLPPVSGNDYVLLGGHLDSWFYGACDNATGNALMLHMAELFAQQQRKRGLRICWWSGHSNGRYCGSSRWAARNYTSLDRHCLALCNSDMPGLRGATTYERCSSGPDLYPCYASVIRNLTGQKVKFPAYVTGWDLSLKNIGISSCMSWSSTLPDQSIDSTGNSFMSHWWHTEQDLMTYVDSKILALDGLVYALSLSRLLESASLLNPHHIATELIQHLCHFDNTEELQKLLLPFCSGHHLKKEEALRQTRILNQALYAFKAPWLQDWAIPLSFLPGLWLGQRASPRSARGKLIVQSFVEDQINRLYCLLSSL